MCVPVPYCELPQAHEAPDERARSPAIAAAHSNRTLCIERSGIELVRYMPIT